jgi:hypothetical protein
MAKHAYDRAHIRAHGRHRRPRTNPLVRTAVAAGGLTGGALVAGVALAPVAHATSADDFARLRGCESGGNYQSDTGNGFYGAYQFDAGTWHSLGYSGVPSDAAPAAQDAAAQRLHSERGWSPWPSCAAALGLGSTSSADYVSATSAAPVVVSTQSAATGAMSEVDSAVWRTDVRSLQTDLNGLGYRIVVDGYYGAQTAQAVRRFQALAGITVDGVTGSQTLHAVHAAKAAAAHQHQPVAQEGRLIV